MLPGRLTLALSLALPACGKSATDEADTLAPSTPPPRKTHDAGVAAGWT